jgi:hypothetical protein
VLLKANGDVAGVRSGVDLERVRDVVLIEHVVQLRGVGAQPVLVADVDRDRAIPAQPGNALIDERERRVGRPLREDRLLVVSDRQIEVERRVLPRGVLILSSPSY